ncbi:hypothetical protein ACOMHN_067276 [Nucella lapillus]
MIDVCDVSIAGVKIRKARDVRPEEVDTQLVCIPVCDVRLEEVDTQLVCIPVCDVRLEEVDTQLVCIPVCDVRLEEVDTQLVCIPVCDVRLEEVDTHRRKAVTLTRATDQGQRDLSTPAQVVSGAADQGVTWPQVFRGQQIKA